MLTTVSLIAALVSSQNALPPWMTEKSQPEDLEISLATFAPGDDLPEWWGHSALIVTDKKLNHTRLYNYGMFGFDEGFVDRFIQGRLEFWVGDAPAMSTFRYYQSQDRDIRIQDFDLTPTQAMEVAKALGTNVLPENRVYLYQHYDDNCSTRPRDILDKAVGGQLLEASKVPARMSLRQHTLRYSQVSAPMSLVLDFMQNDLLEKPITQKEEAYLPDELERQLNAFKVKRDDGSVVPFVKKQWNFYTSKKRARPPEVAPNWNVQLALVGLMFGGLLMWSARRGQRLVLGLGVSFFGLLLGLLGTALFLMGLFTNHAVTYRNENLFLANPVTFMLLPAGFGILINKRFGTRWARFAAAFLAVTSMLGVLVKVIPVFNQNNWNLIALLLPINVLLAAGLWWPEIRTRFAAAKNRSSFTPSPHN